MEGDQFTVCPPEDWLEHPGTVGRARTGRRLFVEPVDTPGGDLVDDPTGNGTIWCDLPDFARFSYWGDEEATRRAWRGPACSIGDLGRLSPDGYLYLTGRRHDLIISGGVNVYPAEIENVLAAVDGVTEVAVFGLPDEQWGQRVCVAFVATDAAAEDALRTAASDRLAPYKRPKTYIRVGDLPHTATGKLMRGKTGLNHLMRKKDGSRRRTLLADGELFKGDRKRISRMLGKGLD